MEDLGAKLNAFLSSEEGVQKLGQLAQALSGQNSDSAQASSNPFSSGQQSQNNNTMPDLSSLMQMFSASGSDQNHSSDSAPTQESDNPFGGLDIGMIMQIQQALSSYRQDDKNTMLLKSLRPHLRAERQHKVDDALKLMKLASLLPMFVKSGLFGGGDR